jgi:hypothetical protein
LPYCIHTPSGLQSSLIVATGVAEVFTFSVVHSTKLTGAVSTARAAA